MKYALVILFAVMLAGCSSAPDISTAEIRTNADSLSNTATGQDAEQLQLRIDSNILGVWEVDEGDHFEVYREDGTMEVTIDMPGLDEPYVTEGAYTIQQDEGNYYFVRCVPASSCLDPFPFKTNGARLTFYNPESQFYNPDGREISSEELWSDDNIRLQLARLE